MEHWSVLGVSDQVKHKPSAIDCSTKFRLLVISMSVCKGLVLRYKNTSGLASRYMYDTNLSAREILFLQSSSTTKLVFQIKQETKICRQTSRSKNNDTDQRKSVFKIFVQAKHKPSYLSSKKSLYCNPRRVTQCKWITIWPCTNSLAQLQNLYRKNLGSVRFSQ